jgi:hypothetical protein
LAEYVRHSRALIAGARAVHERDNPGNVAGGGGAGRFNSNSTGDDLAGHGLLNWSKIDGSVSCDV